MKMFSNLITKLVDFIVTNKYLKLYMGWIVTYFNVLQYLKYIQTISIKNKVSLNTKSPLVQFILHNNWNFPMVMNCWVHTC
jgi:hypothetical protein